MWIQTGVTVRKRLSWVLTSVTLTFDLWSWTFAWTSLLSLVITPENFMMIQRWEHSQKGVTDGQTDWTSHISAWSQLKNSLRPTNHINQILFPNMLLQGTHYLSDTGLLGHKFNGINLIVEQDNFLPITWCRAYIWKVAAWCDMETSAKDWWFTAKLWYPQSVGDGENTLLCKKKTSTIFHAENTRLKKEKNSV